MRNEVEKLIKSGWSEKMLSEKTGLDQSTLNRLRNSKRDLGALGAIRLEIGTNGAVSAERLPLSAEGKEDLELVKRWLRNRDSRKRREAKRKRALAEG